MTDPLDDETRPLPADRTEPRPPTTGESPTPAGDLPAWTRSEDAAGHHPGPVPVPVGPAPVPLPEAAEPPGSTPDPAARTRWSGRRTAVVAAAALALGVLGALGATAAVAQSDGRGADIGGPGGRPGQFPGGGQGQFPGGGQGRFPGDGQGQLPGGPPPGGFDRDGDGDHHGFGDGDGGRGRDGGREGTNPGTPGAPGAPGGSGGSIDPGDANGTTTLTT